MELDEDKEGNVFVKSIEKDSRAERSGKVFVGDIIAMASATFGDDLWSCRGAGLTRVLSVIKVRNSKPVTLVLEAPNEQEEKKRRAIAYAEKSDEEKAAQKLVRIIISNTETWTYVLSSHNTKYRKTMSCWLK